MTSKPLSDFERKLQELCAVAPGCYCPPSHEAHAAIANTPAWLRRYFAELGREEVRNDN